ncbi:unnamed protein product [Paramecium octaurelia]|uniref:Uncharacterized protein n=1 Tax=Paramecium octaurelia TaxID=43137 RepID=A0A8S1WKR8_PAROT|nr:unnamed protein product [Paramecium octaurelia]
MKQLKNQNSISLSPRYQISIRNLLKVRQEPEQDDKLQTWQQIDNYFNYYAQEPQQQTLNASRTSIKLDQQVNQTYLEYFNKKQKEMKHDAFSNIIKSCSEYFIDTLYIALIGESLSDKCDKIGTISQILIGFGIQPGALKNLNESEKREYIIKKFNYTIDALLEKWKEKVESRQQQQITTKVETKIQPQPLKWLNINTKYQSLKIPLAQVLYRKLDELQDIQQMVIKQRQIKLNDITRPTILELIKRMDPQIGKLFISLNFSKNIELSKTFKKQDINQGSIIKKMQKFQWDEELEGAFLENRQRSQIKYANKISTCNFNIMGYLPLIQTLNRRKSMRSDGNEDEVIYEEIKFAKSFSKFLARCVDKKQLQHAVNLVDKDQISALEGNLAEHIIETHQCIVKIIQQARHQFLVKRTQYLRLKSEERECSFKRQVRKVSEKKEMKVKIKRYEMIYKRNKNRNFYVIYFANIVMNKIRQRRKRLQPKIFQFKIYQKGSKKCSKSPTQEKRQRCITEFSTGPIRFKPTKLQMTARIIIKIQALIRRFLAQRFYKKLIKNKLKKVLKIHKQHQIVKF